MVFYNNVIAGASGGEAAADAALINRSVRLNSADSGYLDRTPSSAGNRRTWTFSCWIKRCELSDNRDLFTASINISNRLRIRWRAANIEVQFEESGAQDRLITDAAFRDPSAWYHIVVAVDTTQATGTDRVKAFANGILITSFSTAQYPNQNYESYVNGANSHAIGATSWGFGANPDIYLAETYLIDGQAPGTATDDANGSVTGTPNAEYLTDFGEFDAATGVWQPKAYTGTYGTNGFHLDFSDNSSNAALGNDSSGNNNHWTVNNIAASAPGLSTANEGFDVVTYTGNGTGQSITDLNFQPDFVWLKARSVSYSHQLYDAIRGTTNALVSNTTAQEAVYSGGLTAFNANGFTIGNDGGINNNTSTFVGWAWKAGGTPTTDNVAGAGNVPTAGSVKIDGTNMTTNLAGSLAATRLTANTTYGFSVVTWTVGTAPYTVAHGLGAEPYFIITKSSSANSTNWSTYHKSTGNQSRSYLNLDLAASSGEAAWNNTTPTSDVFSLNNSGEFTGDMVAYCWSEVSGFSKFSDYNGNGSTQTITTGFKPAWIMIKRYDSNAAGADWYILDTKRISGTQEYLLSPNKNNDETATLADYVVLNPDGFLLNTGTTLNGTGRSYIYAAFAAKPDGSTIDSLIDTPTNADTPTDTGAGGEVVGNYATLNPLYVTSSGATLSNGNLDFTTAGSGGNSAMPGTIAVSSGKWYWEITPTAIGSGVSIGIAYASEQTTDYPGYPSTSWGYKSDGNKIHNASASSYGASYTTNDTIGVALDLDAGTLVFYKNGSSQGTAFSSLSGTFVAKIGDLGSQSSMVANFGQRAFAYQNVGVNRPSADFKALCTANLPDPTIADGSTVMDVALWSGTGSNQTISLGFNPDLIWSKTRNYAVNHKIVDSVRGFTEQLETDQTIGEYTNSTGVTGTSSSGFTIGSSNDWNNPLSRTYVGWAWDAGDSNTSIAAGGLNSSVYNQSQTWSGMMSASGGVVNATNAFNGDTSTRSYTNGSTTAERSLTIDFTGQGLSGNVRIFTYVGRASGGPTISLNSGTAVVANDYQVGSELYNWVDLGDDGAVTTIQITINNVSDSSYVGAVEVGGKLLVDSGVSVTNVPTIPYTVRANPSAGFSCVTYSGTLSNTPNPAPTVGHGLNAKPELIISKSRNPNGDDSGAWFINHSYDYANWFRFSGLAGQSIASSGGGTVAEPTTYVFSTYFIVGSNCSSNNYVAYCFAPVPGFSAFGSWVGSSSGSFNYTGFKPKLILFKEATDTGNWQILDAARNTYNQRVDVLFPNLSNPETDSPAGSRAIDFLSNGFMTRGNDSDINTPNQTYIWAAWAESPFKFARAA